MDLFPAIEGAHASFKFNANLPCLPIVTEGYPDAAGSFPIAACGKLAGLS